MSLAVANCISAPPLPAQDPPAVSPARPVRLRVAWGGGDEARRWTGRITLTAGTLSDMQLLGMEADAAGAVWQEGSVIHVDAIRPHRFDGFDITITAPDTARLAVELSAEGLATPFKADVPVAAAARNPFQVTHEKKNVLLVHRAPGDLLRIDTDRDALIFAPGEQFSFTLRQPQEELTPGTTVDVVSTLSRSRGGAPLWSNPPQRLPVPIRGDLTAPVTVPLPLEQGVYTLHVSLAHPPGFGPWSLPVGGNKPPLVERTFQVVVMNDDAGAPAAEPTWQTALEIDPANPRLWQRLPNWLPGVPRGPLGSLVAHSTDHPLGRFVELPPTPPHSEPHWQAYPLPIEMVGVPHVLEIVYPADREQHFGISIVEPNAAGRVVPIGRDSGVYVEGLGRSEQTERHTHRLVFWPRTNSPLLLITNQHATAAAHYGTIRVRRATSKLSGGAVQPPWQSAQRLVTAYIARPLVPETFGASEGLDAASRQSVDDYQTYYEAAQRLAEYLPFAGYNGAVVSVMADGSAIYPSRHLRATPLYDTGRMVASATDLPPTDALELLLREFDRAGLAFVPAIQLATPLPALEPLRRSADPQQSGLEWVGADGRTWLESQGTSRGLAPYYNLLNERVQQAVLDLVDELLNQYGHHPALAGLAVQLSGDGYSQLPGPSWGLDDATVARFERDTGIRLTVPAGPDRFAARAALLAEHADAWRSWRAERVTRFYARVAKLVETSAPERRLFLTSEEMFSTPWLKAQLQPNVLTRVRLDRLMLDLGIDRKRLEQLPGVVVCPAQYIEPASPLADRATDLEINEAITSINESPSDDSSTGAMFFHRPIRLRLSSFDGKGPWESSTWLVSQPSGDASAIRRRYAEALVQGDPPIFVDGGELLPMGQEDATRHVLRALQQLPTSADSSIHRQQPVTVRAYSSPDGTTLVVVNECPWRTEAALVLELPRGSELVRLTDANPPSGQPTRQTLAAGRQSWPLRLEGYGIEILRLSAGGVRVAAVEAKIGDAAKAELEARLADLSDRDLTKRSLYDRLANPGFEAAGAKPLPGWQFTKAAGVSAELDATQPHGGKTCLYLASGGPLASIESDLLPTPATGQLFLTVWLRGENLSPDSELRMVLQTEGAAPFYRNFAALGPKHAKHPLGSDWQHNGFWVKDLPLDSQGQLRVKFELTGKGEVWVDDVQLYNLLFPFPEKDYLHSTAERTEFVILLHAVQKAHETGQIADCVRLLDSYWLRFLAAYTARGEAPKAIARDASPVASPALAPDKPAVPPAETKTGLKRWWPFR